MRSDVMQKTIVNVNVKSLLAPWLVSHCVWSLMRFAIGADGQTAFKRQRGKATRFGEAICYRIPLQLQTKMVSRWDSDGVCSWSGDVIVGTTKGSETTRSFRRNASRSTVESRDCGCLSGYCATHMASLLTHLEEFADVTSRDLWCKSMVRQMVAEFAKEIHSFMCQGVKNGSKTSSIERKQPGQPHAEEELGRVTEEARPVGSACASRTTTNTPTTPKTPPNTNNPIWQGGPETFDFFEFFNFFNFRIFKYCNVLWDHILQNVLIQ